MRTERGLTRERELQSGREVRCESEMTEARDQVSRGRSSGGRIDENTAWFDTVRARRQGEMTSAGDEGGGGRRGGGAKACGAAGRDGRRSEGTKSRARLQLPAQSTVSKFG